MAVEYMQRCVEGFFRNVDAIEGKLQQSMADIVKKREKTLSLLSNFRDVNEKLVEKYSQVDSNGNSAVQQAMVEAMKLTRDTLSNWDVNMHRVAVGMEFMKRNEDKLLAMIFGQVKVGKSRLGNFIAGKQFVDAEFDNEYKHRPHPVFALEKKGRDGNTVCDDKGNVWFTEGVIDTTGAILHYTMSGLRWIDSPGTGALKREGDSEEFTMEQLVNDFINFTDLGVFLMNSSEPGLQTDLAYIKKMIEKGKDTLVVITKSDVTRKVKIDGKWVPVLHAKPLEDRAKQEKYIGDEIDKRFNMGAKYRTEKFKVISISTKLAGDAIKNQDDELFRESNLDEFMDIVGSKISSEAFSLKEKNPKRNLNEFIDNVINGYHSSIDNESQYQGILDIENGLHGVNEKAAKYRHDIETMINRITRSVCAKAKIAIRKEVQKYADIVNQTGRTVSASELSSMANGVASSIMQTEIGNEIGKIIDDFRIENVEKMNIQFDGGLTKVTERIEHKYVEHIPPLPRQPDGIWENIRDFFGHRYYTEGTTKERVQVNIVDKGTNADEIVDRYMQIIGDDVKQVTERELHNIADNYFAPQENYVRELSTKLEELKNSLSMLKFKEV